MSLKATIVGVAASTLVLSSVAIAAPPPGKGKPPTIGAGCAPSVAVILIGRLAADGAAAPSTLAVTVTGLSVSAPGGNRFARTFKHGTQPVSVALTTSTKINRQGDHNPADLKKGDRVNIQARTCEANLMSATPLTLTATRVTAHPSN